MKRHTFPNSSALAFQLQVLLLLVNQNFVVTAGSTKASIPRQPSYVLASVPSLWGYVETSYTLHHSCYPTKTPVHTTLRRFSGCYVICSRSHRLAYQHLGPQQRSARH